MLEARRLDAVPAIFGLQAAGRLLTEAFAPWVQDLGLLVELVNHVAKMRGGVPSGTFVTTGTHTGLVFTDPGSHILADYGPLGRVEVSFPR